MSAFSSACGSPGHQNDFYMFEQIRPEADQIWADAAVTIPGVLYWASGSAPADTRWSPMDPARSLHRAAPGPLRHGRNQITSLITSLNSSVPAFHGGLNYYRAAERISICPAPGRARSHQPSFTCGKGGWAERALSTRGETPGPAFLVSWGISKSTMWATGYNTKPLPRSVTSS